MKNLILIVIFQLTVLLIKTNGDYSFGDIIAFERLRVCPCQKEAVFKHYAVYVGDETFNDKDPKHNIFEYTGTVEEWFKGLINGQKAPIANCVFSTLDVKSKHSLDNYLDKLKEYKAGSKDEIKERIKEKYRDCGTYGPKNNNCEHLATYVRYGVRVSVQHGTLVKGWCKNDPKINTEEILKRIGQDYDTACESMCSASTSNRGPG